MVVVSYVEDHGSPREELGSNGFTAVRDLICAWSLRHTLAANLLRGQGALYEPQPLIPVRAIRVGIQPVPAEQRGVGSVALYEKSRLTVEYGRPEKNTSLLISESLEPAVEYLTLDFEDFRWAADATKTLQENEAPGKAHYSAYYVITRYEVAVIPLAVLNLMDTVNQYPVVAPTLGLTFGAETLLYSPPVMSRNITVDEIEAWNLTFRFAYKKTGWNVFFRQETGEHERIYHESDLVNPHLNHQLADFSPLGLTQDTPEGE